MTTQPVGNPDVLDGGQQNPIDEAQQGLDVQQAGLGMTEPATTVPVQNSVGDLTSQVRGLQSALDRTQAEIGELRKEREQASWQQQIDALPEDDQPVARLVATLGEQVAELRSQVQTGGSTQPRGTEEERQFVTSMGVDPNDPGISYGILGTDEGQKEFMNSIYAVQGWQPPNSGQQRVAAPSQQAPPATVEPTQDTPPVNPAPTSRDAVDAAFVSGEYDSDPDGATIRYHKELSAIGESPY